MLGRKNNERLGWVRFERLLHLFIFIISLSSLKDMLIDLGGGGWEGEKHWPAASCMRPVGG